jgi:flavin reductase (DIM6/NTAB) family NADH-FMN oxidoreductase RutF
MGLVAQARESTPPEFDLTLAEASAWVGAGPEGIGETAVGPVTAEELDIEGDDPAVALRQTLGMFATGVTVITIRVGDQIHGMTANAFMSVSLAPPLVLISVDRGTKMCSMLHEGLRFAVSVLAADQNALSDRFAGRAAEDAPMPSFAIVHEAPVVEGSAAQFVAHVVRSYWGGDHTLFLGQVEYARKTPDAAPLLFHGGHYARLIDDD